MIRRLTLTGFVLAFLFTVTVAQKDIPKNFKIVVSEGFSNDKALRSYEFSDPSQWLISKVGRPGKSIKCNGAGNYENAHGGPAILALLKGYEFEDFILELDMVQNGTDFNLLDFCVFFGVQDKDQYCYAQIASKADRKSHNVFMQDGAKPVRVEEPNTKGVVWKHKEWNKIRVERLVSAKTLKVYFNKVLVLESTQEPFMAGQVGFGSTASAIKVDNLKIWAPAYNETADSVF